MYKARIQDPEYKKLSELDKMKDLACLKMLGQDLATVKRFLDTYAYDGKGLLEALKKTPQEIEEYVKNVIGIDETNKEFESYVIDKL